MIFEQFSVIKTASVEYGLHLNIKKTKVLSTAGLKTFDQDGENIEVVSSFKLLEAVIEDDGLLLGRSAMGRLDNIWRDKHSSNGTKKILVNSLVFPVAMYACETWSVKEAECKRIEHLSTGIGDEC